MLHFVIDFDKVIMFLLFSLSVGWQQRPTTKIFTIMGFSSIREDLRYHIAVCVANVIINKGSELLLLSRQSSVALCY